MKEHLKTYIQGIVPEFVDQEINLFLKYFKLKKVKKKEFILKQGECVKYETFICEGCLHVFHADCNGNEHTLYFGIKDWWLADIDSFINERPSQFNIQAIQDSSVLIINKEDKDKAFREIPKVEKLFRIMCQKSLIVYQQRIIQYNSMSAEDRYIFFIKKYKDIAQLISNKAIASYLGVTPEYISRLRKKAVNIG